MSRSCDVPSRAVTVLVDPPLLEPMALEALKARAHIDGPDEDALLTGYIAAARDYVERRTELALLTQTCEVRFDALPINRPFVLPVRPLQAVSSITVTDREGVVTPLDPSTYAVDLTQSRVLILQAPSGSYRALLPWAIRVVVGWVSVAALPPTLVHAVGLLATHYALGGRDVLQIDQTVETTPYGFEDAIAPHVPVNVA